MLQGQLLQIENTANERKKPENVVERSEVN